MSNAPIYIQRIQVENIKTFVESTELVFTKPNGSLSQWTLLLGDNGIGKSTLLQLLVWMKPKLKLSEHDDREPENYVPGPIMDDEENQTLEHLVHRSANKAQTARIEATFVANQILERKSKNPPQECNTSFSIYTDSNGKFFDFDEKCLTDHEDIFLVQGVEIYAYSASRWIGKSNIKEDSLSDTIVNFVQDKTELYDIEELLHALNYARLDAKNKRSRGRYSRFIVKVKQMLVELLPDFTSTDKFEINAPKILDDEADDGIVITTRHGHRIPFEDFSLGYRSVAAWTLDLAWRLFHKHPESRNPLREPAIVIIDEIDLHLHPKWQREIMSNLSKHFPRVQFIATAHSPLMVQAAVKHNYAVLSYDDELKQVCIENRPEGIAGWRVDQLLTSVLYDNMPSARGLEYEQLLADREALVRIKQRSAAQQRELNRLTLEINKLPTGETPDEIRDRKEVAEFAEKIRKHKIKSKL